MGYGADLGNINSSSVSKFFENDEGVSINTFFAPGENGKQNLASW